MKTGELTGAALDWAVAKCEGDLLPSGGVMLQTWPKYSTNWAQGGPIIERERIDVCVGTDASWCALMNNDADAENDLVFMQGQTPLIAAMRCYVASKVGDEIDIPPELI